MANDYFKAQGWFKNYATSSEDSRGMFQELVKEDEEAFRLASARTDKIRDMINKKFGSGTIKYGSEIPQPEIKTPQAAFEFSQRNPAAEGGRTGFYKGSSAVESNGAKIIELAEAGESSVSIAKKLGLKQQTVNNAINAIEDGLAGPEYKFSKPFKEILKLSVNETGVNLKDPKYLEEVIQFIDENPNLNQKEGMKVLGKKRAILVPAESWGNPGKKWNDEKAKLRNEANKAWTKRYSSISIEDKTRGDTNINRHHAGSLREKVGTDNTMFIDAQDNYKNIRPFEKAIDELQLKQYQTELNRNMPIEQKRKIFADLKKQEDALRAANPEFSKYKSSLIFEESALSPKTGYMKKEVMPNPELTVSEGKTGQNIKYKGVVPSSEDGKKIIELNKKQLDLVKKLNTISNGGGAKGKAATQILAMLAGSTGAAVAGDESDGTSEMLVDAGIGGGAVATIGTKTGRKIFMNLLNASGLPASAAFNIIYGIDPTSSLDRSILGFELAISPAMVKDALRVTDKINNPLLKKIAQVATTVSPKYAMKAAKTAGPIGALMMGGELAYKVATESEPNILIDKETGDPTAFDRENASDVFPSMVDANEQAYKIAKEKNISYEEALKEIDYSRLKNLKNE